MQIVHNSGHQKLCCLRLVTVAFCLSIWLAFFLEHAVHNPRLIPIHES